VLPQRCNGVEDVGAPGVTFDPGTTRKYNAGGEDATMGIGCAAKPNHGQPQRIVELMLDPPNPSPLPETLEAIERPT